MKVLTFIYLFNCFLNTSEELINSDVILNMFVKLAGKLLNNSGYLCYIFEKDKIYNDEIIQHIHRPQLILLHDDIDKQTHNFHCDIYILNVGNLSRVVSHLERRNVSRFLIRPHTTMMIICFDLSDLHLIDLYKPYAINLFVFQIPLSFKNDKSEFKIYSATRRQFIFTYKFKDVIWFNDIKFLEENWKPIYLFNYQQTTMNITLFNCKPFMYENMGLPRGIEIRWIEHLFKDVPRKYLSIPPSENPWKYAIDNVEYGKSNIAGCSQYIVNLVKYNVDYLPIHTQICSTFLVPKSMFIEATFLLQAFKWNVWLSYILVLLLVFVCSVVSLYAVYGYSGDIMILFLNIIRIHTSGPANVLSRYRLTDTRKILIIFVIIYCLLINTYYSAGLNSMLAKPKLIRVINTFEDMVKHKITYQLSSKSIEYQFRGMNSSTFMELADLYRPGVRRDTPLDGKNAITVKSLADSYVTDLDGLNKQKLSRYKVLKECIGNYYIGLAITKNSPLTKSFTDISQRLQEAGIFNKWNEDEIFSEKEYQQQFFNDVDSLHFIRISPKKLVGALVVLVIGYLVASIALVFEIVTFRIFKTRLNLNSNE